MLNHIRSAVLLRHRGMLARLAAVLVAAALPPTAAPAEPPAWIEGTAYAIPKETTNQGSGYFSIVSGLDGRVYVGCAKYGVNAYLVEFDPTSKAMRVAVDAHKEIGTAATGFAAQAKIHTRNNVGPSGRIYFGTKQGYPEEGESRDDYLGGYPMVYDPATDTTRVYPIPVPHQGIISVTPDEARGVAYVSTCSDERPTESTHFLRLDLATGEYRDLIDCRHMYSFIVVDYRGRAYHPILGGELARYDPETDRLERLTQTIDGAPPTAESLLAHPESHPINWDISPDGRTLYAVAMSGNQLYSYDLTSEGATLEGRSLGKLLVSDNVGNTDCRAMCVGPRGEVWAAVSPGSLSGAYNPLRLVSYRAGDAAPREHGAVAIANRDYTEFVDAAGEPLPWHQGIVTAEDGRMTPNTPMGVSQAPDGTVYVLTIAPFTLLEYSQFRFE